MPPNSADVARTLGRGMARASTPAASQGDLWVAPAANAANKGADAAGKAGSAQAGSAQAGSGAGGGSQPPAAAAGPVSDFDAQLSLLTNAAQQVSDAKGALATFGAAMGTLTALEQVITAPLGAIPFPSFPAVRITDLAIGLPHAHAHPPNLVPPAPPVPLPSMGPVIPIPFFSGAMKTLINGLPAARCGDLGLGIWCGGYFPMYEIFLGSANVWVEGQRAARLAVDITKHCIFTTPRPSDPPIGPMVGTTTTGSPNVLIGGIPLPSLTSMAMGAAFKLAFKGVAKVARASGLAAKFSRKAAQESAGQLPRSAALLSEGDPARRVLGAATRSHPEEIAKMRKALEEAGVEILEREGAMAYAPGLRRGEPGQFVIDPEASYSAWLHEFRHAMDDKADGWTGMRILEDQDARWAREQAAYGEEMKLMRELGHDDVAEELAGLMEQERRKIYDPIPGEE